MASSNPRFRAQASKAMNARQWGTPEEATEAAQDLNALRLELAIQRELERAPALRDDQRTALAALLRPASSDGSAPAA